MWVGIERGWEMLVYPRKVLFFTAQTNLWSLKSKQEKWWYKFLTIHFKVFRNKYTIDGTSKLKG